MPARAARPSPALRLVERLRDPACYPHPAGRVALVETHISWVLLAGDYAYKLKKPVDLGFVDFTTLERRRRFCAEEVRLNRRTAPGVYLDVAPIGGTPEAPRIGAEPALEYAVRMRRFDQSLLLDRLARGGDLAPATVDALADAIAAFHASAEHAPHATRFGTPEVVVAAAAQNFDQMDALVAAPADVEHLETLRTWTEREFSERREVFAERRAAGRVRECHGDLHLGNVVLLEGAPVPFDCIEFNDELRWIDVMNEVAFLAMDLLDHRLDALAWRGLNRYLEATGDYGGLAVLRFYLVYRALVRAKIACLRTRQNGLDAAARARLDADYRGYFALARRLAEGARPAIVLMHGLAGAGKTTVAQALLETLGAVRVRSDVERKRLHGLAATARTHQPLDTGVYGPESTRRTYERLAEIARSSADAGFPAIVDAAFLRRAERDAFRGLARSLGVPFAIFACEAPDAALRERIAARERGGADASEATLAVLDRQLAVREPLGADERADAVALDTTAGEAAAGAARRALADRLGIALP